MCTNDGFIKKDSIVLITYSSGFLENSNITFDVVFEAMIFRPVEGMIMSSGSAGSSKLYYYDGSSWNALF